MTNMKRSISDVDSDSDGDFDDYKDGSPSQSCGPPSDRKKRRGIIEKRRRDRINNSLAELRRLVPTAFEKQGSAKLEKAEILQMTVDHLKVLHQKGLNGYNIDPTTLAMDYRSVGFRECAAEVARYLVTVEGLDIQDPLRLRLMSHLQCFSAQREAASKHPLQGSLGGGSWNGHAQSYGGGSLPPPPPSMMSQHHGQEQIPGYPGAMSHSSGLGAGCGDSAMSRLAPPPSHAGSDSAAHMNAHIRLPTTASVAPSMASSVSTSSSPHQMSSPMGLHSQFPSVHTQFPMSLSVNSMPMLSPSGSHNYSTATTSALSQSSSGMGMMAMSSMKPYRPWGAELAY